jgi:hypothetical protein
MVKQADGAATAHRLAFLDIDPLGQPLQRKLSAFRHTFKFILKPLWQAAQPRQSALTQFSHVACRFSPGDIVSDILFEFRTEGASSGKANFVRTTLELIDPI